MSKWIASVPIASLSGAMGKFAGKKRMGLTPFSDWRVYALEKFSTHLLLFHGVRVIILPLSENLALQRGWWKSVGRNEPLQKFPSWRSFVCTFSDDSLALTRSKTLSVVIWLR
ncbi:hypothetical protein NPIL_704081 [Nephila pilipes]|uniref:Uncharacterized protein n=1 Tax=Nephila pilipes TaxID=299642 RepID=A0A8X6I6C5_NEPPI|nr:hypothetical protein NPIL_704081 [Nephila pilipes]